MRTYIIIYIDGSGLQVHRSFVSLPAAETYQLSLNSDSYLIDGIDIGYRVTRVKK